MVALVVLVSTALVAPTLPAVVGVTAPSASSPSRLAGAFRVLARTVSPLCQRLSRDGATMLSTSTERVNDG